MPDFRDYITPPPPPGIGWIFGGYLRYKFIGWLPDPDPGMTGLRVCFWYDYATLE